MSEPCMGWVGKVLGHRFEARYSVEQPASKIDYTGPDPIAAIKASQVRVYECDVCVRCGKTSDPGGPTPAGHPNEPTPRGEP